MLAAVKKGDAKKVAELTRQDPGFNVNMDQSQIENGYTLLHYACLQGSRSAVIPLLLAHPDIDVNLKSTYGSTPFHLACSNGLTPCVREMLKDSRVKVNDPDGGGHTPLFYAAAYDRIDVLRWWIASGREMDLGKPGDVSRTDAIGGAKKGGKKEVVTLLERFKKFPVETRHAMRVELGLLDELAAEMFALVVFFSDGLLKINETTRSPAARFFQIATQLPLELQMVLCRRVVGSSKEIISGKDSEAAFKELAIRL